MCEEAIPGLHGDGQTCNPDRRHGQQLISHVYSARGRAMPHARWGSQAGAEGRGVALEYPVPVGSGLGSIERMR